MSRIENIKQSILPKVTDTKTEKVKWPTVDFAHDMAKDIAKKKKKKRKKDTGSY